MDEFDGMVEDFFSDSLFMRLGCVHLTDEVIEAIITDRAILS